MKSEALVTILIAMFLFTACARKPATDVQARLEETFRTPHGSYRIAVSFNYPGAFPNRLGTRTFLPTLPLTACRRLEKTQPEPGLALSSS